MGHYDEIRSINKKYEDEKSDNVNWPKHYTENKSGVEPIIITEHMSFCLGNVIKYVMRYDLKGGLEDLKKAQWYLNREIKRLDV